MTVETANYIADLDPSLPLGTDPKSEGDNHLRLIKQVLKNTFSNASAPINITAGRVPLEGVATIAQTDITILQGYDPTMIDVYVGGAALNSDDWTSVNATVLRLKTPMAAGTAWKVLIQAQVASTTYYAKASDLNLKVDKAGSTMTGALAINIPAGGTNNALVITAPDPLVLFDQGNVYYHWLSGTMKYVAKNATDRWGWDEGASKFWANGSIWSGTDANQCGQLGTGWMELVNAATGPFIDLHRSSSTDFDYRIMCLDNNNLNFMSSSGSTIRFSSAGEVYAQGSVYAGNAHMGTDGNIYGSLWGNDWFSNWLNRNKVSCTNFPNRLIWTGVAGNYDFIINEDVQRHFFYSDDNRVRSPWTVGNNYLAIKIDTDGAANYSINFVPSDQRLKENIQDAGEALSLINQLKVHSFDWNAQSLQEGKHQPFGIIAQEAVQIDPSLAYRTLDDENGFYQQDVQATVNMLLKAVQELSQQVMDLKAEVVALKGA